MGKHLDPEEMRTADEVLSTRAPDSIEFLEDGSTMERYDGGGFDILNMPHAHVSGILMGWGRFHPDEPIELGMQLRLGENWVPIMLTWSEDGAKGLIRDIQDVLDLKDKADNDLNPENL